MGIFLSCYYKLISLAHLEGSGDNHVSPLSDSPGVLHVVSDHGGGQLPVLSRPISALQVCSTLFQTTEEGSCTKPVNFRSLPRCAPRCFRPRCFRPRRKRRRAGQFPLPPQVCSTLFQTTEEGSCTKPANFRGECEAGWVPDKGQVGDEEDVEQQRGIVLRPKICRPGFEAITDYSKVDKQAAASATGGLSTTPITSFTSLGYWGGKVWPADYGSFTGGDDGRCAQLSGSSYTVKPKRLSSFCAVDRCAVPSITGNTTHPNDHKLGRTNCNKALRDNLGIASFGYEEIP